MKVITLFALGTIMLLNACTSTEPTENALKTITLEEGMEARVDEENSFAFDFLQETLSTTEEDNVFISPLSVSIAMGMTWNGANGATKEEIKQALKHQGLTDEQINRYYQILLNNLPNLDKKTKLILANSIWYKKDFPILKDFLDKNNVYFNAKVQGLDFSKSESLDIINNWCAEKTNNLIKKPLDQISDNSIAFLINAIYFKGLWKNKFDSKHTQEATFTAEDNTSTTVDMMNQTESFDYTEDDDAQYIDLPYGNGAFSMLVILPKQGKKINDIAPNLTKTKWKSIISSLNTESIALQLPRFKVQNKMQLNPILVKLGIEKAFLPEQADFSGISSDAQLYISRVIHQTYCEVNEEGTEAAAVTIVDVAVTSIPIFKEFRANKPFLFLIREKSTGIIVFAGKIGKIANE